MSEFLIRGLLAGLGIAIIAGPLGCFIVWRRMAYFGDTLAHSALLGIALGLILQTSLSLFVVFVCVAVAISLTLLQGQRFLASDTLLGILAHATLAIGMVVVSFVKGVPMDLMGYLFGDILAVNITDLMWIYAGGLSVLALLIYLWPKLLAITIHEDLARVDGLPVDMLRLTLMILLAIVIAIAMKIVGILLITALLIIPSATARRFSTSPEQMAYVSIFFGIVAVVGGLLASYQWDIPTGPSIVTTSAAVFLTSLLFVRRA